MANPFTSYHQGKSYTRQSLANMSQRQLYSNHPLSHGWLLLETNTKHRLPVYHQSGVELMRCPYGDGWIVTYLGERRRVRRHVAELTAKLECAKRQIEAQLSKQFAADVLAA